MGDAMKEREYTTYPRRFDAYKWYKPLLAGVMFGVSFIILGFMIEMFSRIVFGVEVLGEGYDDMDFFSAGGAFTNGAMAAVVIPCILIPALIVRDRPVSSYFSSMGGWRWKVFLKTLLAGFVILGIPSIVRLLIKGQTGDIKFTAGGFILLLIFVPLQGVGEELMYRGFLTQTVSSWFKVPWVGIAVQIVVFTLVHPYNLIGAVGIFVSAVIYALICVFSRGLESGSSLHIVNNMTEIFMAGFGFGAVTSEQTVPNEIFNISFKILFFLFILFASKKLHWFDEVKKDDVALFNSKAKGR